MERTIEVDDFLLLCLVEECGKSRNRLFLCFFLLLEREVTERRKERGRADPDTF